MNDVHVEVMGTGPDLVLLHGWAMHSGIWRNVRDQLAQHYRLHLVDLPGHGCSSACEAASLAQLAETIVSVLPEKAIICGWSLGGQVAMQLALQYPAQVSQLVLIATTPCFVQRSDWQWGMNAATLQLFVNNMAQNYKATINRFLSLQLSGSNDSNVVLAQLRQSFFEYDQPGSSTLKAGLEILRSIDLRAQLAEISQPVLLLHGDNDVITDADAARWMHQQLPNSKLVIFANCGHAPFLSYPDQFISCLNE